MSFRELKDEIFLILLVKGGHGFGFATCPLMITADLTGNTHKSFVTEPGPQPKFENEFVWIMHKAKMKSLWADKIPVRLECHSINQSLRKRIGYVILNLREAQIIQDESKIVEKEIRLLGLSKDASLLKPELSLSFYITDVPLQKPEHVDLLESEGVQSKPGRPLLKSLRRQSVVVPAQSPLASTADGLPVNNPPVALRSERRIARHGQNNTSSNATPPVGAGGDADRLRPLQVPETPPLVAGGETYRASSPIFSASISLTVTALRFHHSYSFHINPDCWLRVKQAGGEECRRQAVLLPQNFRLTALPGQPATLILGQEDQLIASATLLLPNRFSEEEHKATAELHQSGSVEEGEGECVGEVDVTWTLTDWPTALQSQSVASVEAAKPHTDQTQSCTQTLIGVDDVLSPRSRELKITSFVQELEDWAEKQRIMVMEGLKEEEASRLAWLQREWETEVGGQLAEGRRLVGALQDMRDRLAVQHAQLTESQAKMRIYKEELDRVHQSKLQEFKALSRRMQDEFNHKLALIASDKHLLEKEVERLRAENSEIKESAKEIKRKEDSDQRLIDSLNHELSLMKEKLSQGQESNQFFKAHCRKAEQEIHRLNCVRQRELEARLSSERNNMEQLAFQHLMAERSDLKKDQQLLQEIKHHLRPQVDDPSSRNSITNCNAASTDARPFNIQRAT